ncbi:MAG: stage 0 sporulation family protein [Candidatus Cryptobacteroides sp.]
MIESKQYDCSRGCTVERSESGELDCNYRLGCCKLEVYDWLQGVSQEQYKEFFEVRFKNTRKAIYRNASGQSIKTGDLVIVEATNGHDLGIVTLEGPVVARQMKCKRINPDTFEFKRIYRKAKLFDVEKWQEAIAREHETMIRSRQIAAELGLEMKIGDVEFQGDGTKAIFYYIADGRVDFRQLIKVFADEFRIRIEMKQIGARQEAGLIGGLGVCGRELCCSNYISSFQSITTSAARCQDLSLNPQKLAGQCGKLKCCLNYETAAYMDAQTRIPKVTGPLEFEDGLAYLMKTDILKEIMYFSYDQSSLSNLYALDASEVREIIKMNRNGIKPESLQTEPEPSVPEFVTAVGDDSITRFDESRKRRKKKKSQKNNNAGADTDSVQKAQDGSQKPQDGGQRRTDKRQWQKRDRRQKPQQPAGMEDTAAKPEESN